MKSEGEVLGDAPSPTQEHVGSVQPHTPGPWTYEWNPECADWAVFGAPQTDGGGELSIGICTLGDFATEADARLIAAAPELLELLREGSQDMMNHERLAWKDRARRLVAKAEGVSNG